MRRPWYALLALTLAAAGCDDPIVVEDGELTVRAESDAFVIVNGSSSLRSVHFIVELVASAVVDPAPCEEWTPRVGPGERRVVPYSDVIGYADDSETALVYWCLLDGDEPVDGGTLTLPFHQD